MAATVFVLIVVGIALCIMWVAVSLEIGEWVATKVIKRVNRIRDQSEKEEGA